MRVMLQFTTSMDTVLGNVFQTKPIVEHVTPEVIPFSSLETLKYGAWLS